MEHGNWNMQWKMEWDIEWNMQWKLEHAMENGTGYRMEHAMEHGNWNMQWKMEWDIEWNMQWNGACFIFYKSQNSSVPCSCVCSNCNRNLEQTHGTHANNLNGRVISSKATGNHWRQYF